MIGSTQSPTVPPSGNLVAARNSCSKEVTSASTDASLALMPSASARHRWRVSSSHACSCAAGERWRRSEEHTSELQSLTNLVCRLLLEKKKNNNQHARNETTRNTSTD